MQQHMVNEFLQVDATAVLYIVMGYQCDFHTQHDSLAVCRCFLGNITENRIVNQSIIFNVLGANRGPTDNQSPQ